MRPVFIAHASADSAAAIAACQYLETREVRCWLAPRDIQPSEQWVDAINSAIQNASLVLMIFSDTSNKSGRILDQVELASQNHIPLVWFRIEEIQPVSELSGYTDTSRWVNAATPPFESHLEELHLAVRELLGLR